ncbi:hypothetical protein [uncultured Sphingomonas sp.]|nr:hypothetical protein [uncultured Sphingomonas sp.]
MRSKIVTGIAGLALLTIGWLVGRQAAGKRRARWRGGRCRA